MDKEPLKTFQQYKYTVIARYRMEVSLTKDFTAEEKLTIHPRIRVAHIDAMASMIETLDGLIAEFESRCVISD